MLYVKIIKDNYLSKTQLQKGVLNSGTFSTTQHQEKICFAYVFKKYDTYKKIKRLIFLLFSMQPVRSYFESHAAPQVWDPCLNGPHFFQFRSFGLKLEQSHHLSLSPWFAPLCEKIMNELERRRRTENQFTKWWQKNWHQDRKWKKILKLLLEDELPVLFLSYIVSHRFRLTNWDGYFQVTFDQFWSKHYFKRQLGQ